MDRLHPRLVLNLSSRPLRDGFKVSLYNLFNEARGRFIRSRQNLLK